MPSGLGPLLGAGSFVLVVLGLKFAAPILAPFALAGFVALSSLPALMWLVRRGLPRTVAVAILVILDTSLLALCGWILVRSAAEIAAAMPAYLVRLDGILIQLARWSAAWGIDIDPLLDGRFIQPERWLELATSAIYGISNLLTASILVLLFLIFMLSEVANVPGKLHAALAEDLTDLRRFVPVVAEVQEYLALKTLVSLATGGLIGLSAYWLGLDFALLWGLLAFVLNYIPNIGSIIAGVPAVLVALLQLGPGGGLAVLAVYVTVNLVLGNLLEPMLMGRRLGLSTLVVMIALAFWGWVWGVVGMFLAVPLAMVLKIVLEGSERYRWVAVLMGPAVPLSEPPPLQPPGDAPARAAGVRP